MSKTVGERIRYYREKAGLSLDDLAKECGLTGGYLGRLERGEPRYTNPTIDSIDAISKALGVTSVQLLYGGLFGDKQIIESQKLDDLLRKMVRPAGATDAPRYIPNDIPIVGLAKAGRGGFFGDNGIPVDEWTKKIHRPADVDDPNAYAVTVDGDSMEPFIRKGDMLLCVTNMQPAQRDYVVVQTKDDEVMVKEYQHDGKSLLLKSINPLHDPIILDPKQVRALHKVVWIKRS